MLKTAITYKDFNDKSITKDFYFNVSRAEISDMLEMEPRFSAWREKADGPDRKLTTDEIRELLEIIKYLVKLSYGVRSEDGSEFEKSDDIFRKFKSCGAHDAFLWYLFEDPQRAYGFMTGIMPAEAVAEAQKLTKSDISTDAVANSDTAVDLGSVQTLQRVDAFDPNKEFSRSELMALPREQMLAAMEAKMNRPRD